jgi:uncharacterized protein
MTWTLSATALWRRLDSPGHDACRLDTDGAAWRLDGAAVGRHDDGRPARLAYLVETDAAWRTRQGQVRGWIGAQAVELDIVRAEDGGWTLNGAPVPGLEALVDLDLGFTPATNVLPLRRLALPVGGAADAPAAWLDVAAGTLSILQQRYERRSATTYAYATPRYAELLEIAPTGFIRRYPDGWEMEA